jgi:GNAT superfamily N-acetyltransferase
LFESTPVFEYKTEEYNGLRFSTNVENGQLIVRALDDWGTNELGHVVFNIGDNDELDPQDLEVDDRYQGQGVAKIMYDYVKTLGYEIHRSWDQTPAGAGFWNKHRGADTRVWEE